MNAVSDLNPVSSETKKEKHANKAAWGAMFAGAALSVYGWTRKSASGAALGLAGGAIALKAASAGPIADLVGSETALSHSVIMMASASEVFSFCKNAVRLPLWMGAIREQASRVDQQTNGDIPSPNSGNVNNHQIVEEMANQHVRWLIADGHVRGRDCFVDLKLTDLPAARGTLVTLTLRYKLHTGILHSSAPHVIGADPQRHVRESLRKLKMLIEAGEIATIRGQSHGPRTLKGKLVGTLLGEEAA